MTNELHRKPCQFCGKTHLLRTSFPLAEQEAGYQHALDCMQRESVALKNMLAVIHRDGGQHSQRVGIEQSCADAETIVAGLRGKIDVLSDVLREADEVLAVVDADDFEEDESMLKLRMAIAGALAPKFPSSGLF